MFGIEIPDIFRFSMQLGGAIVGASSLWAFVFLRKSRKDPERAKDWKDLAGFLFLLFTGGYLVFFLSWFMVAFVFFPPELAAHEGITLGFSENHLKNGLIFTLPAVLALVIAGAAFILWSLWNKNVLRAHGETFFLLQFILISVFLGFVVFTGALDKDQIFNALHGWHSILTLGTVITIDVLYLATFKRDELKRILYPFFPVMSAIIWTGLGLDFLSVILIIPDAIRVTEQFLFNQTVVAIIIINGALLSEKATDMLVSLIRPDRVASLAPREEILFGISGSVSIVSWSTITFIDFFQLTLSYYQLMFCYVLFIAIAFGVQKITKKLVFEGRQTLETQNI